MTNWYWHAHHVKDQTSSSFWSNPLERELSTPLLIKHISSKGANETWFSQIEGLLRSVRNSPSIWILFQSVRKEFSLYRNLWVNRLCQVRCPAFPFGYFSYFFLYSFYSVLKICIICSSLVRLLSEFSKFSRNSQCSQLTTVSNFVSSRCSLNNHAFGFSGKKV